ncbi:hypothetical protein [Pseudactinotalea sp. Z1748]|uniref:hypothetical protein n=1 Tax=Pseudactinotalea sp. Z1748 TaxID=3413027 RepID=UPI003C7A61CD
MRSQRESRLSKPGPKGRVGWGAVAVLVGAAILIGCSGDDHGPSQHAESLAQQSAAVAEGPREGKQHQDAKGGGQGHHHRGPGGPMQDMGRQNPGVGEHPTWEAADRDSALQRGREAMESFARPALAQVEWLEAMLAFTAPVNDGAGDWP